MTSMNFEKNLERVKSVANEKNTRLNELYEIMSILENSKKELQIGFSNVSNIERQEKVIKHLTKNTHYEIHKYTDEISKYLNSIGIISYRVYWIILVTVSYCVSASIILATIFLSEIKYDIPGIILTWIVLSMIVYAFIYFLEIFEYTDFYWK